MPQLLAARDGVGNTRPCYSTARLPAALVRFRVVQGGKVTAHGLKVMHPPADCPKGQYPSTDFGAGMG